MPRPGEPARLRTEVRFVYDDTNLYVAVTCFQPPDVPMVVNELTQDFNFGQSDALNLVLDTLHDRRSGFMFMTNPGGARRDGQIANDGGDRQHRLGRCLGRQGHSQRAGVDRRVHDPVQDAALHRLDRTRNGAST